MAHSSIEWTEMTWNPTTGCDKVTAGCRSCYAEVMSMRLQAMGVEKYSAGFKVKIHPEALDAPYKWSRPRKVFVNSMSDLFHKDIPLEFIKRVFRVMNENPHHIFQILTKRADILLEYSKHLNWTGNIWMGVSVEDNRVLDRIGFLINTPAKVKFLSIEPLIGPIEHLPLQGIDWVIVGGESGYMARPMLVSWVESIQRQCIEKHVPFFFKQWGGFNKKKAGRTLNGRTFDEMPASVV